MSRSSSGRRRRGRCPRTSRPPSSPRRSTACATRESGLPSSVSPTTTFVERARGSELVGLEYEGPYDHFAAAKEIVHRVIPWDEVSLDEGTGIVHIAPGAGTEDFELSTVHDLPVLIPVDESGRFLPELRMAARDLDGRRCGSDRRRPTRARAARARRHVHPPLPALLALRDAADLPVVGRLVHRASDELPSAAARRERDRQVDARLLREAHGRLAAQHGRLEHLPQALLRTAAADLPLRRAAA